MYVGILPFFIEAKTNYLSSQACTLFHFIVLRSSTTPIGTGLYLDCKSWFTPLKHYVASLSAYSTIHKVPGRYYTWPPVRNFVTVRHIATNSTFTRSKKTDYQGDNFSRLQR